MRLLLIVAMLALVAAPAAADPTLPEADITKGAVLGYVRPAFAQFATDTAAMQGAVTSLCDAPSDAGLETAQEGFKTAVLSYARVEFLHFGALTLSDRAERLLFWPDSKGIALKQVQQVLAQKDPAATDPGTLSKKSVALQGLGALEFVLFGTGSDGLAAGDAYRCSYGKAVSTLIAGIAATLSAEWQDESEAGPLAHMLAPSPSAFDYRSTREVLEKLTSALLFGNEMLRDQRLLPILGTAEGSPKPKSGLFWRSGMTVPMLQAEFAGLKDYFLAARFPEAVKGNLWISNGALFEFDNAVEALGKVTDPLDKAVADEAQLRQLNVVVHVTRTLDTLLGENLSGALGLSIGFSGLDGD